MNFLKTFCFTLCLSLLAHSGPHIVGNGGDGVVVGKSVYLLDLVEHSLEREPYFAKLEENIFLEKLKNSVPYFLPTSLIAGKMMEIYQKDKIFAASLYRLIKMMDWRLIDYRLVDIPDSNTAINSTHVQLAVRQGEVVFLDELYWRKMDAANQAALIFHELLYALQRPKKDVTSEYNQFSRDVIKLVGFLFSEKIAEVSEEEFVTKLKGAYPSRSTLPLFKGQVVRENDVLMSESLEDFSSYLADSAENQTHVCDFKDPENHEIYLYSFNLKLRPSRVGNLNFIFWHMNFSEMPFILPQLQKYCDERVRNTVNSDSVKMN